MTNYSLTAKSPLDGFDQTWGDTRLTEIADRSFLSAATPLDGNTAFKKFMKAQFGTGVPAPGKSETTKNITVMGMARDQFFVSLPFAQIPLSPQLRNAAQGVAHMTDQSDSWARLSISGPNVRIALERICPIDLNPNKFEVGDVARTAMEHLNVVIMRSDVDKFELMSARSSALSFLHAVQTSIENT